MHNKIKHESINGNNKVNKGFNEVTQQNPGRDSGKEIEEAYIDSFLVLENQGRKFVYHVFLLFFILVLKINIYCHFTYVNK